MDHHCLTPIFPASSSPRSQSKAVAPEASPERSCSLHSCPLEDPSSSSWTTTSNFHPPACGPVQPLGPAHPTYPRAPQEHRGKLPARAWGPGQDCAPMAPASALPQPPHSVMGPGSQHLCSTTWSASGKEGPAAGQLPWKVGQGCKVGPTPEV